MTIDTETIDRLFLELSQFTKAKTAREIELEHETYQLAAQNVWAIDVIRGYAAEFPNYENGKPACVHGELFLEELEKERKP